jgi:transaldolase
VQKFHTHVSVELHPDVAFDIEGTLALARRYYAINPEWFYVKVPLTQEGLLAVKILSKENIPVNLTIGFSARQNYLAARLANPSFVNVFLGRLNSLVEENSLGNPVNVGEKATLASDEMMKNLRSSGAARTNQIAASIRSGSQIPTLAGVDVYTIPPKSAAEYLAQDVSQDDIQYRNWRDLPVELQASGVIHPSAFNVLWDIDKEYISFVDEVVKNVDSINIGSDLDRIARKHGVNVFHDWTAEEHNRIREQGKIPQVHDWPGISIDTMMTMAALECFAKDQIEVDDRIRHMITLSTDIGV